VLHVIVTPPDRPGPQGPNQIAATLEEQVARVFQPRPVRPFAAKAKARILLVCDEAIAELWKDLPTFIDARIAAAGRQSWRGATPA
jgi:hypothetical protein